MKFEQSFGLVISQLSYIICIYYRINLYGDFFSPFYLIIQAAMVFRMKLTHVPVDPVTSAADVNAMRKAINKNTCLVINIY